MANLSKHAFGSKENIETAKAAGSIDEFDVIFMDNGEVGWLDKNNNTVINTPRTQQVHTLNGVSLGALSDGDSVPVETSIDEFIAMITQKPIPATYTRPTISLVNNGGQSSGNVEAGTTITPKLKATFTKNDAGDMTSIVIKQGSTEVATGTESPLTYAGDAIVVGDETVSFTASATYGDAPVKKNNLGAESTENWLAGSTITSSTYSIAGKRNMFYGTGVGDVPEITSDFVRGLSNKKLAPAQGNTLTISVAVGQQYVVIAYPANIRDINKVTYVEANDGGMASNFEKYTIDVADARGGENGMVSYKVFIYHMAVPAAAALTFNVVI